MYGRSFYGLLLHMFEVDGLKNSLNGFLVLKLERSKHQKTIPAFTNQMDNTFWERVDKLKIRFRALSLLFLYLNQL